MVPLQAAAADFGFVRWPDYLDAWIALSGILSVALLVWLRRLLPPGQHFTAIPPARRSRTLNLVAYGLVISVVTCLGLIFTGMGLQRLAE
ncbi:hypothetical protein [Aphanothece microscopica]|uniref:hypothetical protein n=1 Tax=Aphanothece microscopica TaxID=1049561 RepID=UPI003CE593FE